jgi:hypothetical protein
MEENNNSIMESVMCAFMTQQAITFTPKVLQLMEKYENSGIDVIPVKEIKKAMSEAISESLADDSFSNYILNKRTEEQ